MTSHIQLRKKTYYARLSVPPELRQIWGRSELIQSLKTSDKKVAEVRVLGVIGKWKEQFHEMQTGEQGLEIHALSIRKEVDSSPRDEITGMSAKDEYIEHVAEHLGESQGKRFRQIASGSLTPFAGLLDEYMEQWDVQEKTKAMGLTAIKRVAEVFSYLEDATIQSVDRLIRDDTNSTGTKRKNYNFVAQYWAYLERLGLTGNSRNPFANRKYKTDNSRPKRLSFTKDEVVAIHQHATVRGDVQLADLIYLAAYTGARIEELCSLKTVDVRVEAGRLCMRISDAKTAAGIRTVPLHTKTISLVEKLTQDSSDGYLFSGLKPNKYGKRSDAIGKRFGRLKTQLGHSSSLVFHSIRKTFITALENLGISEGLTADIVGHEKDSMTYGLYSTGHSVANKVAAVEQLHYDFPEA